MQTIAGIMTRDVVTISENATLREAAALLSEKQISGAPVVDAQGNLVGILSESDLLNEGRKRAALPRTAAFGGFLASEEVLQRLYHAGADLCVRSVMSTNLQMATEETTVIEATRTMISKKINRLPVVDSEGTLVGIVTREDLLKAVFSL
ncbi:CBS domain-containing protein [Armatimonas sp.]|uniref:CBS domain-containing protein n=1 Tax=Armatimonas sp. TaxID=1872638 RepID=UPI0037519A06